MARKEQDEPQQQSLTEATAAGGIPLPRLSESGPEGPVPVAQPGAAQGNEPEVPRRKRKRRTKEEMAAATAKDAPAEPGAEDMDRTKLALKATFQGLGSLLARKRGEHWAFTSEEADTMAGAWTAALAPYLPRIGAAGPWAAAAAITWTVLQPRIEQDARAAAAKRLISEVGGTTP